MFEETLMNLPCTKAMLVQVVYSLSAIVTFSLCAFALDGSLFAWHPTFMSVGFLGLMTLGIVRSITFRKLDGKARVKAIQIHGFIQTAASSCMFAGLGCIVQNKMLHNKAHLTSVHAKCGALTSLMAITAALGGMLAFKKLGLIHMFPEQLHGTLKWIHRHLGLLTYIAALTTIELALTHAAVYKAVWTQLWQMITVMLGIAMLMLALQQDRSKLPVHVQLQSVSTVSHPGKLQ